jgi:hypothetical protein
MKKRKGIEMIKIIISLIGFIGPISTAHAGIRIESNWGCSEPPSTVTCTDRSGATRTLRDSGCSIDCSNVPNSGPSCSPALCWPTDDPFSEDEAGKPKASSCSCSVQS